MAAEQPQHLSNKLLGTIMVGLLTTLFGGVGVMYYLGMFSEVTVIRMPAPAYHIAYLSQTGSYNNIKPYIEKVDAYLKHSDTEATTPFALFLDDIGSTPESKRRAKIGYILKRNDAAPAPLDEEIFPQREVITATFSGGRLLGSYKVYEAMKQWAKANHYTLVLPALEIYHPDKGTEYQLGIRKE